MGRGTLGTSRGIAAATSTAAPSSTSSQVLTPQEQSTAKRLNKLHRSYLFTKRQTYHIGDRTAVISATDSNGSMMYILQTREGTNAAQTQQSTDFNAIKAAAKKHLRV